MDTPVRPKETTQRLTYRTHVRQANPREVFDLLDLIGAVITDTPYPPPEVPYCIQATLDLIARGLVVVAALDEAPDMLCGVLMLDTARWPWTAPNSPSGTYLYNQHYFVLPKYRRSRAGIDLLEEAKRLADGVGLPLMIEITTRDGDTGLKEKFVESRGFDYVGAKLLRLPLRA